MEVVAIEANSTMMDLYMLHQVGSRDNHDCERMCDNILCVETTRNAAPMSPVFLACVFCAVISRRTPVV